MKSIYQKAILPAIAAVMLSAGCATPEYTKRQNVIVEENGLNAERNVRKKPLANSEKKPVMIKVPQVNLPQFNIDLPPVVAANATKGGSLRAGGLESYIFTGVAQDDGHIEKYTWNFGDGTTSNEPLTMHTYMNPGKYNVTLSVRDNSGNLGLTKIVVNVNK